MNFRIVGLPANEFEHLFELSDADLAAVGGVRRTADGNYPCRVRMMVDCRLVDGREVEPVIGSLLTPSNVDYLHIHFASPGCYAAKVMRAVR